MYNKLIYVPLNRIIRSILLPSLITLFIISCTDENYIKTGISNNNQIFYEKPDPDKIVVYADCSDQIPPPWSTNSCEEPHCSCPTNYTRSDLDPCNYDNMEDYAIAVCCELNRISTNCYAPGLPYGCTEFESCIKSLSTPAEFLQNHPNSNPWLYCDSSTDCEETWTCPILNLSFMVHLYLTEDDQDILVDYAWGLAWDNLPEGCEYEIEPYAVYFKVCRQGNYPFNCENESTLCTNLDIRLHIIYKRVVLLTCQGEFYFSNRVSI